MKKLMGFLFVLVFILGIIFVLLPFLETTPPPSAVPAAQARPRPQIFTSNPLTTLVKRIVNALQTEWDKKREKRRLAVARMQGKRKLAPTNYRAALLKTLPSQEEPPGEPIELPQGEDDGNWLIAPQISPEDMGVKGMHEVNTDEELPQSAEMQATEQPLQALPLVSPTEENASFSAQKEPLLLARANTNLQLPKPARYAPEPTKTQAPLSETEKALKELMDVVYPERRLAKLVEDYASVKFGLIPATPASLKEKEAFIKEKKEQVIKEFRRLQWEDIMRMLDSQEPPPPPAKDYLGNYVRAAKREGKETIDLPITIVSKGEEGKVLSAGIPSVDAEKLQKEVAAKIVGKAMVVGTVFNPNSDDNEEILLFLNNLANGGPKRLGEKATDKVKEFWEDVYDEKTNKGETPTPATGKQPSKTAWDIVTDFTNSLSLRLTETPETGTVSTYLDQDKRLASEPILLPPPLEQTQGKTSTPAQKPNKMVEMTIDLLNPPGIGGFPLLLKEDGDLVSMNIMRYAQGATLGLNEEEKSEEDISMNSPQHPGSFQSRWKKFATGETPYEKNY